MRVTKGSHVMDIYYDELRTKMLVSNTYGTFYYMVNAQGDVTGLVNSSGVRVVEYHYDAWGNLLSTTGSSGIGAENPLRYRGYVYDIETGLYYLQSRYYDPEMGRFINADDYVSTGQGQISKNTFAYCYNNPVNYIDEQGASPWAIVIGIVACAVIIGIDHWLAANQPEGGFGVKEKRRSYATVRGLYAEGNGFEVDANGVTVCDTEIGLASFSTKNGFIEAEILDILTAHATASFDWSGTPSLDISAAASIYSPCATITIPLGFFNATITAEALIGAVGVGIELDPSSGKFKITPPILGVGGSYEVDFDLVG